MSASPIAGRQRARRLLVQALYQWQMGAGDGGEIIVQFLDDRDTGAADRDYFRDSMRALTDDISRYDASIEPYLQRSLAMVDPVERAILRLACYELHERPEIPARVVIDEAIGLARLFGSDEGHRFVNGLLDRLAHELRPREFGPVTGGS